MLYEKYLLRCFQPDHPGHKHTTKPDPPRKLKPNILLRREVVHPFKNSSLTNKDIKKGQKIIHDQAVRDCIEQYTANKVLNRPPPEINNSEETLTRGARASLSRLPLGNSKLLKSYLARIDTPDLCPDCNQGPHDVHHLFNCPMKQTTLTVESLWKNPVEAAKFLNLQ
jgi:hypothetical protein